MSLPSFKRTGDRPLVHIMDLGRISYAEAWALQERLLREVVAVKRRNRTVEDPVPVPHRFLFCEHEPVYTLGKSGKEDHLLLGPDQLSSQGIDYYKINRGGDITYHGPGQIVGYPILDLECFFTDVHRYVRSLEEAIIRTLAEYELEATRLPGYTGVWRKDAGQSGWRKICAIGVHLSRWVTMHGFALNVNTELQYFDQIIPCGIQDGDKEVTSMSRELGLEVDQSQVQERLLFHFSRIFDFDYEVAVGADGSQPARR